MFIQRKSPFPLPVMANALLASCAKAQIENSKMKAESKSLSFISNNLFLKN